MILTNEWHNKKFFKYKFFKLIFKIFLYYIIDLTASRYENRNFSPSLI